MVLNEIFIEPCLLAEEFLGICESIVLFKLWLLIIEA